MSERTFKPADAHKLDDPDRLLWLPPNEIVQRVGVAGKTIADIGAGTGYFAIPFAALADLIYAVDLQPEMLAILKSKLESSPVAAKVRPLQGSAESTSLPDGCCDLVFLANVWHEIEAPAAALREIRRVLKPTGELAILDWHPDRDRPPGPPLEHRLTSDAVAATLTANGWRIVESSDVAKYHYLIKAVC